MKMLFMSLVSIFLWIHIGGFYGIEDQLARDVGYLQDVFYLIIEEFFIKIPLPPLNLSLNFPLKFP